MYKTIAESNNFIVLDKFTNYIEVNDALVAYQTEAALEKEFIQDLINQGYENPINLNTPETIDLKKMDSIEYSRIEELRLSN